MGSNGSACGSSQIVNILLSPFFGCLFGFASFSIVTLSWVTGACAVRVLAVFFRLNELFAYINQGLMLENISSDQRLCF